jgi:hypothetical protein
MAIDLASRHLFILDSQTAEILSVDLDNQFSLISRIDLLSLGAASLRGIAVHPISHNLFILSPHEEILYELTQSGQLVNTYDLTVLELVDPRGLAFGPSADLTDTPDTVHLFVADSNLPDTDPVNPTQSVYGRVLEVALESGSSGGIVQTVLAQVASSADDSEEKAESGATSLDSSDLELIEHEGDYQIVGVRFGGVAIPAGATIVDAYIEFVADQKDSDPASLTFYGEATDDAPPFEDDNSDISTRSLTTASVIWSDIPPWTVVHEAHRTPDLSPIVQEIVNRRGWKSGNAMAFIISGTGSRTAEAYDGEPVLAPKLVIRYQVPAPTGTPVSIIRVPDDAATIQAGIDLAVDGDVVLVAPGEYRENIEIAGKTIILASQFYTTNQPSLIEETIIDGNGNTAITVASSAGLETKIVGFTIRNGDDGISAAARLHILNNHFVGNNDAIDYEGGGGVCRHNVFDDNSDDAIDLDGPTEVTIEHNIIRNSGDDGIEIRLQPYNGPILNIVIRNNLISDSAEDGIQLIDYPALSDRVFRIERNVIRHSAQAGMGLMDEGETKEDYRGASIPERILLFNNTFIDNDHGLTGGDNLVAVNNIFIGSRNIALKNVDGNSIVAHTLFWGNGIDQQNAAVDPTTTLFADPRLDADHRLLPDSPAIDRGAALFMWQSEVVLDLQAAEYFGAAPDLGAYEGVVGPVLGTRKLWPVTVHR